MIQGLHFEKDSSTKKERCLVGHVLSSMKSCKFELLLFKASIMYFKKIVLESSKDKYQRKFSSLF